MTTINLTLNGETVAAEIEARTSLADFIRDHQNLTATHLGCEHGACGCCTIVLDGRPVRSCITLALACEGSDVRTLEGLRNDPVIQLLNRCFKEKHGLQCGYCTPGQLVTARDIVTRIPDADEARVRVELSGNLCRCTGYQGIVDSVLMALAERRKG